MTRKEKAERVEFLKRELNQPKRELIRLYSQMQDVSPREAAKLDKIIERLERLQSN